MLKFVATVSLLFRCSETFSHHSERSLLCDILMSDINVDMFYRYDNVCLVRIDRYDYAINNVHSGTPAQAYTLDITKDSLHYDDREQHQNNGLLNMMSTYWVIYWVA